MRGIAEIKSSEVPERQIEIALAEYGEMRAELSRRSQAKGTLLALALTATAAVGSYGYGAADRREALLVLPFVMSGLALVYLHYTILSRAIGSYIQTELWPFLQAISKTDANGTQLPSWESWAARTRKTRGPSSATGLVSFLGQVVIFGVPAVGALLITCTLAWNHSLAPVWCLGLLAIVGAICIVVIVERRELSLADRG